MIRAAKAAVLLLPALVLMSDIYRPTLTAQPGETLGSGTRQAAARQPPSASSYVPPRGDWARRLPAAAGFESMKPAEAIAIAISRESGSPRDLELNHYATFGREPLGDHRRAEAPRGSY